MGAAGAAVVARAISLCSQYNSADRREIIRNYWPFFRDDEHFANWCQIGFSFTDGMKSAILADYTRTLISDVARLNEGNRLRIFALNVLSFRIFTNFKISTNSTVLLNQKSVTGK